MSNTIDLSILIVSWNTREMLRDCLRSVYAGIGTLSAEVVVIDNASSDESAAMVSAEFPHARLMVNPNNRGFAAANNQGLAIAGGRNVLLLNSDTLVRGAVLKSSVAYMDRHPKVGAMGCRVLNADGSDQRSCSRFPTLANLGLLASGLFRFQKHPILGRYHYGGFEFDRERDVDTVSGCFLLARMDAVRKVGVLDEAFFFYGEETDWCRRFRAAGYLVRFAPVGEITHFGSGSSRRLNHRRDLLLSEGLIRLHKKHGGLLSAAAAWMILLGFNASRLAGWAFMCLFSVRDHSRGRRSHFRRVVQEFSQAWPRVKGAA